MLDKNKKIFVLGAGIVGLAIAKKLKEVGYKKVVLIEKEKNIALHQSSRNSGVMHAGLYYAPKSLKAELSRKGIKLMKKYCDVNSIAWEECGKIVIAKNSGELDRLNSLFERGKTNNLKGIQILNASKINKIEPYVEAHSGILVPEESIVDYKVVARSFLNDFLSLGGIVKYNSRVISISSKKEITFLHLENKEILAGDILICTTGLYSDKTAKMCQFEIDKKQIIPFRGEYFLLKKEFRYLVKGLIYPTPNPSFPFLGVHLTKMIDGGVEAGPNAVLALAREGYDWQTINYRELFESITYPGLIKFIRKYPLTTCGEVLRSLSKNLFVRSLQNLVPDIKDDMLIKGEAGIRAQLMNSKGGLEQDFDIRIKDKFISVLNAPSPAATSSLAIADYVLNYLNLGS